MKKRLRFIYRFINRYLTTSKRWHPWLNAQIVLLFVVSCIFLAVLSWSAPFSVDSQHREAASRRPFTAVDAAAIARDVGQNSLASVALVDGAAQDPQITATPPAATRPAPTATPFPPEFAYNSQQTIGLTITATVLVLIVVFGVLIFMPKKTE